MGPLPLGVARVCGQVPGCARAQHGAPGDQQTPGPARQDADPGQAGDPVAASGQLGSRAQDLLERCSRRNLHPVWVGSINTLKWIARSSRSSGAGGRDPGFVPVPVTRSAEPMSPTRPGARNMAVTVPLPVPPPDLPASRTGAHRDDRSHHRPDRPRPHARRRRVHRLDRVRRHRRREDALHGRRLPAGVRPGRQARRHDHRPRHRRGVRRQGPRPDHLHDRRAGGGPPGLRRQPAPRSTRCCARWSSTRCAASRSSRTTGSSA